MSEDSLPACLVYVLKNWSANISVYNGALKLNPDSPVCVSRGLPAVAFEHQVRIHTRPTRHPSATSMAGHRARRLLLKFPRKSGVVFLPSVLICNELSVYVSSDLLHVRALRTQSS
jgi:hypothetical protein